MLKHMWQIWFFPEIALIDLFFSIAFFQNPNKEEEEPVDITDRFYQFRFVVEPKLEKKSFLVREEITDRKEHAIRSLDNDEFERWVGKEYFDTTTVAALNKTFELRKLITAMDRKIYEEEAEIREINKTQR